MSACAPAAKQVAFAPDALVVKMEKLSIAPQVRKSQGDSQSKIVEVARRRLQEAPQRRIIRNLRDSMIWTLHEEAEILLEHHEDLLASKLLEWALEWNEENSDTHGRLGRALACMKQYEPAKQHLHRALILDENNSDARLHLAQVFRACNKLLAAEHHAVRALTQLNKKYNGRPATALAKSQLVSALGVVGSIIRLDNERQEMAEFYLKLALDLNYNDHYAHGQLGYMQCEQRKWTDAKIHLTFAIALYKYDPRVHEKLGTCLQLLGELKEAATHFRQALQLDSQSRFASESLRAVEAQIREQDDTYNRERPSRVMDILSNPYEVYGISFALEAPVSQ